MVDRVQRDYGEGGVKNALRFQEHEKAQRPDAEICGRRVDHFSLEKRICQMSSERSLYWEIRTVPRLPDRVGKR